MSRVVLGEAVLGFPVHGQKGGVAVHHPSKVDAVPNCMGQANNFRILIEVLLGSDNSRQKQGSVYRRDFGGAPSRAGRGIDEVIVPAVLVYRLFAIEVKRREY